MHKLYNRLNILLIAHFLATSPAHVLFFAFIHCLSQLYALYTVVSKIKLT